MDTLLAGYSQLDKQDIFDPQRVEDLSYGEKVESLHLITMVKEKRDGVIKARECADERKQRRYTSKEEVESPTIQLESIIMSLLIDAREGRDIATSDVVGLYLLANMKDYVLLRLTGDIVNMMCQINPKYLSHVTQEGGKQALYMRLKKALYGCMQSAILWYITFKNCLEHFGFKLNPYDRCIANKTVNGEQCTICWHVDDISHVDPKIVD